MEKVGEKVGEGRTSLRKLEKVGEGMRKLEKAGERLEKVLRVSEVPRWLSEGPWKVPRGEKVGEKVAESCRKLLKVEKV